jgi:polygalacturonase
MIRRSVSSRSFLWLLCLAATFPAASLQAFAATVECNPHAFGAVGDGIARDTAAIQKAIDVCAEKGGGTVRLVRGTYLSAPVVLRSNITLWLDQGATLLGTRDHKDYPVQPEFREPGKRPLIGATNQSNVAIRGAGVIDGQGSAWWVKKNEPEVDGPAPKMIIFDNCRHVLIEGITIQNSPGWNLVPYDSDDVTIRNLKILAPPDSPNTDAIDPFSSSNVRIEHVFADVGDDDIAIKAGEPGVPGQDRPSENITIVDCTFLHGHGLSIGSDVTGGVRNVVVDRVHFADTNNGIRIKSNRDRGGDVSHLVFRNIDMKRVKTTINIYAYSDTETALTQNGPSPDGETMQKVTRLTPRFHDIVFENLTSVDSLSAGEILGLPESLVSGLVLRNVSIRAQHGLVVRYANVSGTGTVVTAASGQSITKQQQASVSLH